MNSHEIPLIEDLTLSRIGDLICINYDYAKQDLGDFIHRDERTFRRKANGTAKIYQKDVDWLIDSMIKMLYKGNETKFYTMLKEWFPSLQRFNSQSDIRKIFTANLMGLVSLKADIKSPISDSIEFSQLIDKNNVLPLKTLYQKSFYNEISDAIFSYLIIPDPNNSTSTYYGWNRLQKNKTTPGEWSTADGLCIAVYTNCRNTTYLKYRGSILESLWQKRDLDFRGFKSDNQMYPSLSATSLVAKAFFMEREFIKAKEIFDDLLYLWKNRQNYTYNNKKIPLSILCYVLNTMTLFEYKGPEVKEIEEMILKRAILDEKKEIQYWTQYEMTEKSLANTACAITALVNSYRLRNEENLIIPRLHACEKWICSSNWEDSFEIYHRSCTFNGHTTNDITQFSQYTAPECITALLTLGHNKKDPLIVNQLLSIISSRKNGMWSFPINSSIYQMWVTHEILMCIDVYKNAPG